MLKKNITFGILGLGRVVEKRLISVFLNELKNAKVDIVYDKDKSKTNKYSKLLNCKKATKFSDLFDKNLDFIYIATESGNHYQHIKKCFLANHNVIVEKPPVLKESQLLELVKIAKRKKLKFYSVFQNRLNKSVQFVKNYIRKNKDLVYITLDLSWSRFQNYYNDWHGNWKMDGGVVAQQGIHYIDILVYLFGKPIKCVSTISNKTNKLQAEDTHNSLIIFKNNLSCTCNFTTALRPEDHEASIKIYMKKQIINLEGLCCNIVNYTNYDKSKDNKLSTVCKKNSEKVDSGYGRSHFRVIQNIVDDELEIRNKFRPIKAEDTLQTIRLLNMMYMSAELNQWIFSKSKNIKSKLGN